MRNRKRNRRGHLDHIEDGKLLAAISGFFGTFFLVALAALLVNCALFVGAVYVFFYIGKSFGAF